MARKPDIQYIDKFYVHGSEARVLELKPQKKKAKTVLPEAVPVKEKVVQVDLLSLSAIAVAVTMIALMVMGCYQLKAAYDRSAVMSHHVIAQQNENVDLSRTYYNGFDLADIEQKALALGMIPVEDALTLTISGIIPEEAPAPTMWENFTWFMKGLLA